jgi:hypothetical protein
VTCQELLENLAAYLARELDADVLVLLERHVGECKTCGGVVETYRLTLLVVRALPDHCDPLPTGVADRLKAALAREGFVVG